MSTPIAVLPAAIAAGVAAYYERDRSEAEMIALAGGAGATALGAVLIVEEQNYLVAGALTIIGAVVTYSLLRRR